MAKQPAPGSAAEIVARDGIQAIRGVPLKDGNLTVYVSSRRIDKMVQEEAAWLADGETPFPAWRQRVYGGDAPDADMVYWMNLNCLTLAEQPSAAQECRA
ncbi:hypothetical protein [Geopseudomonas aromaticivorans]